MLDWVNAKIKAAQRMYGQADKKYFGGNLPGGAARPGRETWNTPGAPGGPPAPAPQPYTPAAQDPQFDSIQEDFASGRNTSQQGMNTFQNPQGSNITVNNFCALDRQSHKRGLKSQQMYGQRTKDGPDGGKNACVESVQRWLEQSGNRRIPTGGNSPKDFIRNLPFQIPGVPYVGKGAQNVDELQIGILQGRGRRLGPGETPGPGDITVQGDHMNFDYHAHFGTNTRMRRTDKDGNTVYDPVIYSNSGSSGGIVGVKTPRDTETTKFKTYRLYPDIDLDEQRTRLQNEYRQSGGGW